MKTKAHGPKHFQEFRRLNKNAGAKCAAALLVAAVCLSITACGPRRVRVDFTNYEKSYAITSNREVLLNLARLEQRDPTYFFKLGQISSQYRMQASLTSTGSYLPVGSAGTNQLPGGTGGPGVVLENDPQFTMIPVDDQTLTRLLLSPVQPDVFYDLYYQGRRVDQLFRLMVDRIEITLPNPDGNGCTVQIIRNEPPPVFRNGTPAIDYIHEQAAIASYVNFLRISAVVYALQKYGYLQLRGATEFEPLDKKSWLPVDAGKPAGDESKPASDAPQVTTVNDRTTVTVSVPPAKSGGGGNSAAPTAKEFDETAAKNEYWEQMMVPGPDGKLVNAWVLGTMAHRTVFQLTSSVQQGKSTSESNYGDHVRDVEEQLHTIFTSDESLRGMDQAPELTDILEILYNGFSIEGQSDQQEVENGFCPTDWTKGAPSRLVLRSLIGVMSAAAQEEDAFKQMESDDPQILLLAKDDGEAVPHQLTASMDDFETALGKASMEFVQNSPQKPDINNFSQLAQMTAKIHLGLVVLNQVQKQREGQPQGQPPNVKAIEDAVLRDVENPNSAYAKTAIQFLMNAQKNQGELGAFKGLVPPIEQQPVLQIDWSTPKRNGAKSGQAVPNYLPPQGKTSDLKASGFLVKYEGREFMVTDPDLSKVSPECANDAARKDLTCYARENQYWNRDMFRLIGELSSQVTVDTSKYPLPAVLQLVP